MTELKKIYLVTSGVYSDYGVAAVFSDIELAKDYCRVHNLDRDGGLDKEKSYKISYWDYYRIEEWEINKKVNCNFTVPEQDKLAYRVLMSKDGNLSYVYQVPCVKWDILVDVNKITVYPISYEHFFIEGDYNSPEYNKGKELKEQFSYHSYMETYVFARDEKHAIKIANERRIQLLALNRWPSYEIIEEIVNATVEFYSNNYIEMTLSGEVLNKVDTEVEGWVKPN